MFECMFSISEIDKISLRVGIGDCKKIVKKIYIDWYSKDLVENKQ